MKRFTLIGALFLLVAGCTSDGIARLSTDQAAAQQTLAATTQATTATQAIVNALPVGAPQRAAATQEIATALKVESDAQLAINLAQAAINSAQKQDATEPALGAALAAAVAAIPSPWTPVLASLIPAAIPLVVSIVQSVKLGRAHQTVQNVTQQLQVHQAALAALATPLAQAAAISAATKSQ